MTADGIWTGIEREASTFAESLSASGACGRRVAAFDWSATPLGALGAWERSLQALVGMMMVSRQPMALWYGPQLTTIFNDGFADLLGNRAEAAMGQPARVVWHDVWADIEPLIRATLSGQTVWREDMPLTMTRGGVEEETFWTFSYSPVRGEDGRIAGLLDVVTETTEAMTLRARMEEANRTLRAEVENGQRALAAQRAAEEQAQVLRNELVHRMKNLLAIVQAIVTQSIRGALTVDAALESVSARLVAFGRAQDLLTSDYRDRTHLRRVVDAALSPYRAGDRFDIAGPDVHINAQQCLGIALALHELGTNATKYGALRHAGGRVAISWDADGNRFDFTWKESGVPAPAPPSRRGFGTKLTEQIVASYFSGTAQVTYEPDGIAYRLSGTLMPDGVADM